MDVYTFVPLFILSISMSNIAKDIKKKEHPFLFLGLLCQFPQIPPGDTTLLFHS